MSGQDIRWIQRFNSFQKAYSQLSDFLSHLPLNQREEQGLIQSFEYNYELAWNTIKDFYESQGESNIQGSRDAFRLAFKRGLIENGDIWMDMIKSRMLTSHTYNEETAKQVVEAIINIYAGELGKLVESFRAIDS